MAAFGTAAYANEYAALNGLINASIAAGYVPDTDLGGDGIVTAVLASCLVDGLPLAAGTVTAPSLATTGDTNTGLFFSAADKVDVTAGGVRVMRFNTVGTGVNFIDVTPAATTTSPIIAAAGSDTNIDIVLTPKGTGGVTFPDGAVGTPAITNAGDLNTGLYFSAADKVDVSCGGVRAARFNTATTGVNYVDITPAAAAANPAISVEGTDTNISLALDGKGTGGVTIGGGNPIGIVRILSATLTPAAVAANTIVEQTFTGVTGLTTDDIVVGVMKPTVNGGAAVVGGRSVAAGNLGLAFANATASAVTPTAGEVYKLFTMSLGVDD